MNKLVEIFEQANKNFLDERDFILSGVSERCLCGELMKKIDKEKNHTEYSNYYVDIEYNRNNGEIKTINNGKHQVLNITCDIILHSRGENTSQDNLIALEMKKDTGSRSEKEKDRNRLRALTKDSFNDVWSFDG